MMFRKWRIDKSKLLAYRPEDARRQLPKLNPSHMLGQLPPATTCHTNYIYRAFALHLLSRFVCQNS